MEILGIGPLEILFILVIALIVIGPKDMAKTGRTIGRWLRKLVTSPTWHTVQHTTRELRGLPYKLMREAGLEEEEMKKLSQEMSLKGVSNELKGFGAELSSWTTPPGDGYSLLDEDNGSTIAPPAEPPTIAPPAANPTPENPDQPDDDVRS